MTTPILRLVTTVLLVSPGALGRADAAITRIEITERKPAFGGASFGTVGAYEVLRGRAFGELDPADPHNRVIVDLALAPRNARGRVEYVTDLLIARPVDLTKANGRVIFELNNRGDIRSLNLFNSGAQGNDLTASEPAGNGFLMRMGYVIVACGWDATVDAENDQLTIQVPVARNADGSAITGPALEEFVIDGATTRSRSLTYPAATTDTTRAQLTVRTFYSDPPRPVPPAEWTFVDARTVALLPKGQAFAAGSLYELTYQATEPLVVGVGFAAVRDVGALLRTPARDNPTGIDVAHIYTAGSSQPVRFAHDLLALGFNESESGRQVFDAMLNWVGGASGGFFNYRFAQPGRTHRQRIGRRYPEFAFPFTNQVLTDAVTGRTGGRMSACAASRTCPKVFEVNSEAEYWTKGMSLLHTDTQGRDLEDEPNTRTYLLSNLPHSATTSTQLCQQPPNPLSPSPTLRALLTALDQWVSKDVQPPPSRVPRVADGTLVTPDSQAVVGFPGIPGVVYNGRLHTGDLFDFGPNWQAGVLTQLPPALLGMPYPVMVPKTDADGHDLAGIRQVEIAVPVATYTGWGLRRGPAAGDGCDAIGQRLPFAATRSERDRSSDPRLSLEERYPTPEVYIGRVTATTQELVAERLLLTEDADRYLQVARERGVPR